MSRLKRVLLVSTTAASLLVLTVVTASATAGGRGALRAAGTSAVLLSAGGTAHSQPVRLAATAPGVALRVSVGHRWELQGKLIITGTMTISCGPLVLTPNGFNDAQVTIEQASGDDVSHTTGPLEPFACDGAPHTTNITALANDAPISPGDAVAIVQAFVCGVNPTTGQNVCLDVNRPLTEITIQG
jgi:hypothetical protein